MYQSPLWMVAAVTFAVLALGLVLTYLSELHQTRGNWGGFLLPHQAPERQGGAVLVLCGGEDVAFGGYFLLARASIARRGAASNRRLVARQAAGGWWGALLVVLFGRHRLTDEARAREWIAAKAAGMLAAGALALVVGLPLLLLV
jgi:hypothetical protein